MSKLPKSHNLPHPSATNEVVDEWGQIKPIPCPEKVAAYRDREAKKFAESSQNLDKSFFKVMCEQGVKQIEYEKQVFPL